MKTLILLLTVVLFTFPAPAKTIRGLQGAVRQAVQKNEPSDSSSRQGQIKDALVKVVYEKGNTVSWAYVEEKSKKWLQKQRDYEKEGFRELCNAFDTDCQLFNSINPTYHYGYTRPDYAKETKNVKYIYVSDASAHETQTIPAEVNTLCGMFAVPTPKPGFYWLPNLP